MGGSLVAVKMAAKDFRRGYDEGNGEHEDEK